MKHFISHTAFLLLAAMTWLLGAGTMVAQCLGASWALKYVYAAPWTVALWALIMIFASLYIIRRVRTLRLATLLLHVSFVCMLLGAATTHCWGRMGTMHLAEKQPPTALYENIETHRVEHLPFTVELLAARVEYYPETQIPSDYVSEVVLRDANGHELYAGCIRMNKVLAHQHFRFFQTGMGEGTSVLRVQYDPWGIGLMGVGCGLLFVSILLILLPKARLQFSPAVRKVGFLALCLLLLALAVKTMPDAWRGCAEALFSRAVLPLPTAGFALLWAFVGWFVRGVQESKWRFAYHGALDARWMYLLMAFCLRWAVRGNLPLTNGHETMMALALILSTCGVLPSRHGLLLRPLSLVACSGALLVARMAGTGQDALLLVPVLASPLLSVHVCAIIVAYALFFIMALLSVRYLWRGDKQALALQQKLLKPALLLLAAGIVLGGYWANQSWGRYWGWDPKEVWALITLLAYSFPLHAESLPIFRRPRVLSAYLLIAFACVLMTYFGVNFLLGGLHSYATA